MWLILHRALKSPEATLGTLSVSTGNKEQFICYTLEDCYREIDGEPVANWKIKGLTAIPRGEYEIKYTESAYMPVIQRRIQMVAYSQDLHSTQTQ